jgi:hypothetical protein
MGRKIGAVETPDQAMARASRVCFSAMHAQQTSLPGLFGFLPQRRSPAMMSGGPGAVAEQHIGEGGGQQGTAWGHPGQRGSAGGAATAQPLFSLARALSTATSRRVLSAWRPLRVRPRRRPMGLHPHASPCSSHAPSPTPRTPFHNRSPTVGPPTLQPPEGEAESTSSSGSGGVVGQ